MPDKEFKLYEVKSSDTKYIEEACRLLKNTYRDWLSKFFIYQNKSYKTYLKEALDKKIYVLYVCLAGKKQEMAGFILLKKNEEKLFIVNIIVLEDFRNKKAGNFLIKESATYLYNDDQKLSTTALDVFETNQLAYKWYSKLGFEIKGHSNWYNIPVKFKSEQISNRHDEPPFQIYTDDLGFKQLSDKSEWLGTLIDGKNFILRKEVNLDKLNLLSAFLQTKKVNSLCWVTSREESFLMIDRSINMQINTSQLIASNL